MAYVPRDERKARLAEAVWRIILDKGISAVSVRTVATEAEMAVGSLRHLFPTQTALLEFSADLMVERATARVTATEPSADAVEYALSAIQHLVPLTPETRREFEINIALIAESPAHPGLARIRNHAHAQLLDLFTRITTMLRAETKPSEDARRDSWRLLALVDGLGLHLVQQRLNVDTEWAIAIIRDELVRIREAGSSRSAE
ncbi:TetR/AcrR family transcriptional regulator [Micromonospora sp. NBC_01412]|uniref:TetR/AcrR family transcriptional regulator n=1 Tax=Micromonospora sp. NBC_01412 TaxID=2903590 RepID=UPI0032446332